MEYITRQPLLYVYFKQKLSIHVYHEKLFIIAFCKNLFVKAAIFDIERQDINRFFKICKYDKDCNHKEMCKHCVKV